MDCLETLFSPYNILFGIPLLFWCVMRHNQKIKDKCRKMGRASQRAQAKSRLSNALNYRPTTSYLVFEINTSNPRNGIKHHIEIRHEIDNGNNRYNVYLDGKRWQKQWSRFGFCRWLFGKIDRVVR